MGATPRRSPRKEARERISPYPSRERRAPDRLASPLQSTTPTSAHKRVNHGPVGRAAPALSVSPASTRLGSTFQATAPTQALSPRSDATIDCETIYPAERTPAPLPQSAILNVRRSSPRSSPASRTGNSSTTPARTSHAVQMTLAFEEDGDGGDREDDEDGDGGRSGAGSTVCNYDDGDALTPALYKLVVMPIIKQTVTGRDTSGKALKEHTVAGDSFDEIIKKLWTTFCARLKCRAVAEDDDSWSVQEPDVDQWRKSMQFNIKTKVVDANKNEREWRQWLVGRQGKPVHLLLYEYGTALQTKKVYNAFVAACIQPDHTDRAGATAEEDLRAVMADLQRQWRNQYDAEIVVWRLWANHITRNLNRSTWAAAVQKLPPNHILRLLRQSQTNSHTQQHLTSVRRSATLALEMVNAMIKDHDQLRREWEAFDRRLQMTQESLATRKSVVEAIIRDLVPPSHNDVVDPVAQLVNIEDFEHREFN